MRKITVTEGMEFGSKKCSRTVEIEMKSEHMEGERSPDVKKIAREIHDLLSKAQYEPIE